ncbi:hypothetical protein BT69DRAFT_1346091 [Atractiella rhizophila]|nr:hypothetical protein BT69DRAFT_1346091 [Atractiella rhizophila]
MSRQTHNASPANNRRGSSQGQFATFTSPANPAGPQRRGSSNSVKGVNSPKTPNASLHPHHHGHSASVDSPATATASAAAGAPAVQDRDLRELIGASIKLTMVPSGSSIPERTYQGLLWCYDASMGCVALECSPSSSAPTTTGSSSNASRKKCYRIIKINQIKAVEILPSKGEKLYVKMKSVNVAGLQAKERDAIRAEEYRKSRIGPKGVGKEGQDLFDALSKTMPVRWAGTSIVVMDEVIISHPYALTDCNASAKDSARLERVKKVMEGEQIRLGMNTPTANG